MTLRKDCGITWASDIFYWLTVSDGVSWLGFTSTGLVNLYPSHYEGFGFARSGGNGLWELATPVLTVRPMPEQ